MTIRVMTIRGMAAAAVLSMLGISGVAHAKTVSLPNDPGYAQQWGLQKMRVPEAWTIARGAGIIVAVVDTGVNATHPDLRGHVLPGRDFVDDDADASDGKGHGTHVAGTIAAVTGNNLGVSAVAPEARILPVRVLGSSGEGDPGDVASGIRWAVDRGAKIINLSLAQDANDGVALGDSLLRDTRVDDAIKTAARNGALVVVAAGNRDAGGESHTSYDATTPGVIVVGATTRKDLRAAYSNYGDGLDVVAPGGGSATDAKACTSSDWVVSTWWNPATKQSDYGGGCGTSMAVAHVSGVAALLLSRGLSNVAAVQRIIATAVDLGPHGKDLQTGYGRVDAFRAVGADVKVAANGRTGKASPSTSGALSVATVKPLTVGHPPETDRSPIALAAVPSPRAADPGSRALPLSAAATLLAVVGTLHLARRSRLAGR